LSETFDIGFVKDICVNQNLPITKKVTYPKIFGNLTLRFSGFPRISAAENALLRISGKARILSVQ